MKMLGSTFAALEILFVFCLLMATPLSSNTALASPYDDCSKGDLVKQHACLICRMIYKHDDDNLKKLLQSPYANVNDVSSCAVLATAFVSNNESAFKILIQNGANPNVRMAGGSFGGSLSLLRWLDDQTRATPPIVAIDLLRVYQLMLDAGYNVDTLDQSNGWGMSMLTWNLLNCRDRPEKRMAVAKLLREKGADSYQTGDGHVNFLHQLAFFDAKTTDCVIPILKATGIEPWITKTIQDEDGRILWFDDAGRSPIDYSMSSWDKFTNYCIRLSRADATNNYRFAEYLASLHKEIADEFERKKKNWKPGTRFSCSLAKNMNAPPR